MLTKMGKKGSSCIIFSIMLISSFFTISISSEQMIDDYRGFSDSNNSFANFTSAGSSTVAISGEPAHVGDEMIASILVSNVGSNNGVANLIIENLEDGISHSGAPVEISPGSSREVKAPITSQEQGSVSYRWWISSNGSHVNASLSGEFSVEVLPRQTISTYLESYDWSPSEGLVLDASLFLSSGASRPLLLDIFISKDDGPLNHLQEYTIEMDPGRRNLQIFLGNPSADSVFVELSPIEWSPNPTSLNYSTLTVNSPSADPSLLDIECTVSSLEPTSGESVRMKVNLTNNDNFQSPSGKLRIVLSSDQSILAESVIPPINPGVSVSYEMVIQSWPDSEIVQLEIIWSSEESSSSVFLSVQSSVRDDGFAFPFDISSALLGALSGIVIVLTGRLVWRATSSRTPSTSESGIRKTRIEREEHSANVQTREIDCPFCEQRLSIPAEHDGNARCPSCSMQFNVAKMGETTSSIDEKPEAIENEIPMSFSTDDILECPGCDQTLRVPIEKRPVQSRCPVCKLEFLAEKG